MTTYNSNIIYIHIFIYSIYYLLNFNSIPDFREEK